MTATQLAASAVTESMSLAAVRNFLRAAVSCITFSRGLCGDDSFFPYKFAGVEMQQLCSKSAEGSQIISWLNEGAFDALNKKYLHEVALCVLSADATETLESYCFTITYSPGADDRAAVRLVAGPHNNLSSQPDAAAETATSQSALSTGEDAATGGLLLSTVPTSRERKKRTKESIIEDMRRLFAHLGDQISRLPPLLPDRVVTMRLVYNERAPLNYQPPNFQHASASMNALYRREMRSELRLGSVDAKHLAVSAAIRHPLYQLVKQATRDSQLSEGATGPIETTSAALASSDISSSERASHVSSTPAGTQSSSAHRKRSTPGFTVSASQLASLRPVHAMLTAQKALRPAEVCFLVFTVFVFLQAPILRGGHAELHLTDVERYLAHDCIFPNVPLATFLAVMAKLTDQGLLAPFATTVKECTAWQVRDPPAAGVSRLRRQHQVTLYLRPSELDQLAILDQRLAQSGQNTAASPVNAAASPRVTRKRQR